MILTSANLEKQLLETAAGQAVYDSLVQANVNLNHVSVELVKQMLVAECRFRRTIGTYDRTDSLSLC
ncbi:MAG: hypothetical protein R3C49_17080 [Planctomycetaceae bacterium]